MARALPPALQAPLFASLAVTLFSLNDVTIKALSDAYALHQLVLARAGIGLIFILLVVAPLSGGWQQLRTKRPLAQMIRALFLVIANLSFFMGLATLSVAETVAIFFVSPLIITVFSVVFLKESVGVRRWSAIFVGLVGVLIIMRPGTEAFQLASIMPLIAATCYGALHIMTRFLRDTETAVSMTFYILIGFIVVSVVTGLVIGHGRYGNQGDPSLDFLFRAWRWFEVADLKWVVFIGFCGAIGGICISQAYRLGEAAFVAPFEYLALPLGIVLGYVIFGDIPDAMAMLGITLILSAGLYSAWREMHVAPQNIETPNRR